MIIDTEVHPLIVAHPSRTNPQWSMVKHFTWHEHPAELLVAEMDQAGVGGAFLISYDAEDILWSLETKGLSLEDFAGGPKYCQLGLKKFPGRFWWFNTVKDPRRYDAAELVRKDIADGAVGIKLFPAYIHSHLTSDGLIDVFEQLARANARALVSFQTLRPPHTLTLEEYLSEMDEILSRFPTVNFALMQGGCADPLTDATKPVIALARKHANVYLSTGAVGEVWDDDTEYPFPNYLRRIEMLMKEAGAHRLMWGTDWPWFEDKFKYKQAVDSIRRHADFMSEREKGLFLGETALRFLGH